MLNETLIMISYSPLLWLCKTKNRLPSRLKKSYLRPCSPCLFVSSWPCALQSASKINNIAQLMCCLTTVVHCSLLPLPIYAFDNLLHVMWEYFFRLSTDILLSELTCPSYSRLLQFINSKAPITFGTRGPGPYGPHSNANHAWQFVMLRNTSLLKYFDRNQGLRGEVRFNF